MDKHIDDMQPLRPRWWVRDPDAWEPRITAPALARAWSMLCSLSTACVHSGLTATIMPSLHWSMILTIWATHHRQRSKEKKIIDQCSWESESALAELPHCIARRIIFFRSRFMFCISYFLARYFFWNRVAMILRALFLWNQVCKRIFYWMIISHTKPPTLCDFIYYFLYPSMAYLSFLQINYFWVFPPAHYYDDASLLFCLDPDPKIIKAMTARKNKWIEVVVGFYLRFGAAPRPGP